RLRPKLYYRLDEVALPTTANLGSLGSANKGVLIYPVVSADPGPSPASTPAFPGFDPTNTGVAFSGGSGSGGAGGYVSVVPLNLNTNGVTITCWVKPNGSQAGGAGIIMHRTKTGSPTTGTSAGLIFDQAPGLALSYNWDGDNATYSW